MDFYPTTTTNNKGLLTKRQNPYTQAFKTQPSNAISEPNSAINLQRNDFSSPSKQTLHNFNQQNSVPPITISSPQNPAQSEVIQNNCSRRPSTLENPISLDEDDEDGDGADCSGPIFEKLEKKIKTTMLTPNEQKIPRRFSYDEDKQSDHSTFCETYSEATGNNENGDFPYSPTMNHLSSKNSDLKSDSMEENPASPSLNSASNTTNSSPKTQPQDLIKNIAENMAACNFQPGAKQKMRCKLNHQCDFDLSNISKRGCSRCQELLEECRQFAKGHNGRCTNEEYDTTITYQCHKGHIWNLNYKNARRRWCAQCAKDERNLLKKKCEEEKVHREKQEEQVQQNLFEEARKKAMRENQQNNFAFGGQKPEANNSQQKPMSTQEYFQRVDFEIETLAKKYSNEFMAQKEFKNDIEYTQILQVYKILIMPEQILQCYMFNLNGDALRSEFRRMAKIIHPDKNKHPQAGAAFQKIYKVYEVALNRVEGK